MSQPRSIELVSVLDELPLSELLDDDVDSAPLDDDDVGDGSELVLGSTTPLDDDAEVVSAAARSESEVHATAQQAHTSAASGALTPPEWPPSTRSVSRLATHRGGRRNRDRTCDQRGVNAPLYH